MEMRMVEGSGLSRKNRLSARQMGKILDVFDALPAADAPRRRGVLQNRLSETESAPARATSMETAAAYRFVVMCNTPGKGTERIMDRIKALVAAIDRETGKRN